VFTYVRRDFIDGTNRYGARTLYRSVRKGNRPGRPQKSLWHFGLQPEEVAAFLEEYGWRLVEQVGPDELIERYVEPTGRKLKASQIEWSAFAEKV
jgi:O-methyltransferase involved in polyketide biosynthesis